MKEIVTNLLKTNLINLNLLVGKILIKIPNNQINQLFRMITNS